MYSAQVLNDAAAANKQCHDYSFLRLCDYLVVTMLHDLTVKSTTHILSVLKAQTAKDAQIVDLVRELPDSIEEQEKMLQVLTHALLTISHYGY